MARRFPYLIAMAGLLVCVGMWSACKQLQEPLDERKSDILLYVKQHDGIDAVVLGHGGYASGGTAWFVQPKGDASVSFTVVDNGLFRTHIVSDDYEELFTRP